MRQPNWPLYIYMYTLPLIIFGLFFFTKFILYKLQYSVQSFVSLRLVCTLWRQVAYTCTQPFFPWEIRKLSIKLVIQNADKTLVHGGKEGGDRIVEGGDWPEGHQGPPRNACTHPPPPNHRQPPNPRLWTVRMADSDYLRSLVESMPRRLAEVIERGGNPTKY